jgi:hypothetical protein
MATYSNKGEKKSLGDCIITAVADFGEDLIYASEIEFINLENLKGTSNLPVQFFLINLSIDKVLISIKERLPDLLPPFKEYRKTRENKKENKD